MNIKKNITQNSNGFTLLELVVVSILMVIVIMITNQFWRWFSPGVADLIAREHILRESRLLTGSLACDFGSADLSTEISGGDQLVVNGIRYYRESDSDKNLYRQDISVTGGPDFVIADCVADFWVQENPPNTNQWQITVLFEGQSYKKTLPFRKEVVFHWSPPD